MTKGNLLDPVEAFAKAIGGRRVCQTCTAHLRALIAGLPWNHARCDDIECGCRCQDAARAS